MPATEELRILLRTVADTTGASQTQQALKTTQTQAATSSKLNAQSLLAMAGAAGIATVATDRLMGFVGDSVDVLRDHERIIRATTASYGQQTEAWVKFAQQLSATTGFTSDAILEAALSARTLSTNYGLSIQQTQQLIKASADLARVRGIGVAEAFERVQSAIRGEAEASEYLGLTLNDTYIANNAMNGSLKTTFNTMTDQQKAQVRYNELLKQSAAFAGLAAGSATSLDGAMGRLANSTNKLQLEVGKLAAPALIAGLQKTADLIEFIAGGGVAGAIGRQAEAPRVAAEQQNAAIREELLLQERILKANNEARQAAEAGNAAQRRAADAANRRLRELNDTFVPKLDNAATLARLAYLDQVDAAVRELTDAQNRQVELQRESVDLAAEEASIRLGMLPAQERLAALQRDVTEQQIRARQAALPATEALEDLRYQQERARLIAASRTMSLEDRRQARRDLRSLTRAEPDVALAALEAGRGVTLAGRAAERVGLEQQLFQLTQERTLSQIRLAEETNSLLSTIAQQRTQAIVLTINMSADDFVTQVYQQLVEANQQAQLPPTIPQSGVRR